MQISFSPMRRDDRLSLSVAGDILTINGEAFDFSALPEGATLPRGAVSSDWLASDIDRVNGELHLTVIAPHGANAPQSTLFPQPVTALEGAVPVPEPEQPEDQEEDTPDV